MSAVLAVSEPSQSILSQGESALMSVAADPQARRHALGRAVGDAMEMAWTCLREAVQEIEDAGIAITETVVLTRPAGWRVRAGTYLPGGAQLHRINPATSHPQALVIEEIFNGLDQDRPRLCASTLRLLAEADRAITRMLAAEAELRLLTDEPALPWRTASGYWRNLPEGFPILLPLKGVAEGRAKAGQSPESLRAFRRSLSEAERASLTENQILARFALA